jgi:aminoglycoside phosphotransferase (APT) family kinase protein
MVAKIARLAPVILNLSNDHQSVVLHSDLHGEHIFEFQGQLSGVIDFGAAFTGLPAWEFAVLAYYHGWPATETVLATYTQQIAALEIQTDQVRLLAIVVALYKLSKLAHPTVADAKVQRIGNFIGETLVH